MTSIRTYEASLSLIDERNELPLRAALVAAVTAWTEAFLLTLVLRQS
jgi:hypothetical protein